MEELLRNEVELLNNTLSNFLITGSRSIQEHEIDCSKLSERFFNEDIRDSDEFRILFEKLKAVQDNPCLYILKIESDTSTNLILTKLKEFGSQTEKVIPKLKTKISESSKVLYVGKANSLVWGRLITHMGFHTHKNKGNPKASINHGLQLFFWAKEICLKIKYIVIEFEPNMKDMLPILEKKLADKLSPVVGKHKY